MIIRSPGGRDLEVGAGKTRLMGVVNATPDSFQGVGRHLDADAAIAHGLTLLAAGADILDVGGESTRPGHQRVDAAEQCRRILPVIEGLRARSQAPISVDTTLGEVAERALAAGADWVNDTTAFGQDPGLAAVCARHGCPVVLMHRFDPPRQEGSSPPPGRALVTQVGDWLAERVELALQTGIERSRIVLDPGVGFGTMSADNLAMHAFLSELRKPGLPLLFGTSRKRFLGDVTGRAAEDRLLATAGSVGYLAAAGVEILRVHDIGAMRDVVAVVDAIRASARASIEEQGASR